MFLSMFSDAGRGRLPSIDPVYPPIAPETRAFNILRITLRPSRDVVLFANDEDVLRVVHVRLPARWVLAQDVHLPTFSWTYNNNTHDRSNTPTPVQTVRGSRCNCSNRSFINYKRSH